MNMSVHWSIIYNSEILNDLSKKKKKKAKSYPPKKHRKKLMLMTVFFQKWGSNFGKTSKNK